MAQTAASPLRLSAAVTHSILEHPSNPWAYTLPGRQLASGLRLYEFMTRPYDKPAFGLRTVNVGSGRVAVNNEVVYTKPFADLRRFSVAQNDVGERLQVLIVAPLSGHHATLVRDTIKRFLAVADVYVTDWQDARNVPLDQGDFDLDDYIDYVRDFIRHIGADVDTDVNVVAVCQPGPAVLSAIALMAEDDEPVAPTSLTLMGSPIDPRKSPTVPNRFAEEHSLDWFRQHLISTVPSLYPGAGRSVYPGFIQLTGFINMNLDRHVEAYLGYYGDMLAGDEDAVLAHETFYEDYNSVIDMTAEFYLQTIERVFHNRDIATGDMMHRGRAVRPSAIRRTALLTVEGEKDDISGLGQTRAAHDVCTGIADADKHHYMQPGAGHYGVFSGRRWRNEIAPRVIEFMRTSGRA